MTTIVSIHQPNNDLFQMFDNIYVLAKGGVCVYSGSPSNLRQHLIYCGIECNEKQFPIEMILRVSSNEENNESIKRMVEKTRINLPDISTKQYLKQKIGSINITKRFFPIDFYYLLLRTISSKYMKQWKEVVIQVLIYLSIAFSMKSLVTPEMVIPNGCLEIDFGMGCNQTVQDIKDEALLKLNINYHFYFTVSLSLIVVIIHSLTFCSDFKILFNECKNGNQLFLSLLSS